MPVVTVLPQGSRLQCDEGANLMRVLLDAGFLVDSPCNGRGTCGKCGVEVDGRTVLSCQVSVTADMAVCMPNATSEMQDILTFGYLPEFDKDFASPGSYGIAVDIGTTTVACTLVDLSTGKPLESASAVNVQSKYGTDVLTRITYEVEQGEEAIADLQKAIVSSLDELCAGLLAKTGVDGANVEKMVVAANCTMLHMLLGRDARSMGRAPYQPAFTESQCVEAAQLGFASLPNCSVLCLPSVSAYIGADIVAGAYACELAQADDVVLLVDIGTNGEIVLSNRGDMSCCSCAAGPALEGMNISSGMQAAPGAVQDMVVTNQGVELDVIGGGAPRGLCGSGILAAVRELVAHRFIRKNGAYVKLDALEEGDIRKSLLRLDGKKRQLVIERDGASLVVTQGDIRQVQLAKGALLSGFIVLLDKAGLSLSDVDRVLVAGQFGAHLPAESLTGVGILPHQLKEKISYVGNSSKSGAYMALMSNQVACGMDDLARQITYVELSDAEGYERLFSDCLLFEGC